jgi:OmpA-OmpF porin, OOP family
MSKRKGLLVLLLTVWIGFCLLWFFVISKKGDTKSVNANKIIALKQRAVEEAQTDTNNLQENVSETTVDIVDETAVTSTTENLVAKNSPVQSGTTIADAEKEPTANVVKQPVPAVSETLANTSVVSTCYFSLSGTHIKKFSPRAIKKLRTALSANNAQVVVTGHTDYVGSKDYNYQLGMQRAEKIKMLLAKNGIDINRIQVASKGEEAPVYSNKTVKGRSKNRRVEIAILS